MHVYLNISRSLLLFFFVFYASQNKISDGLVAMQVEALKLIREKIIK
jgi:hypothetical protein